MAYIRETVDLPLGQGGLNGSKNLTLVPPEYLVIAENVTYVDGTLQKEAGAIQFNTTPISGAPRIVGGWDHSTNALVSRMIVGCNDGTLRKDAGGGVFSITLKSGLSTGIRPYFVEGGKETAGNDRKTFIFTGTNPVMVLANDGVATPDITGAPADWSGTNQPVVGAIHEGRLWGAGNLNDPHRVYYSQPANHENFTLAGSGSLPVYPGEGAKIVGMLSYKGFLLVWKAPRGIYYVDTSPVSTAEWRPVKITAAVGAQSPHSIVQTDEDILFFDATGAIQSMAGVQEFGSVAGRNLSQLAALDTFIRRTLNLGRLNLSQGIYYPAKRELHITCSAVGTSAQNRMLVIDLNLDIPRFRMNTRDIAESIFLYRDVDGIQRPVIGDDVGFVWRLDQPTRSQGTLGYTGKARTAPYDLGVPFKVKQGEFLELYMENVGSYPVNVGIYWDDTLTQVFQILQSLGGGAIGSFVIGTDVIGTEGLINYRRRLEGSGKRISLEFSNSTAAQTFSITRALLSYHLADEE